MQEYKSSVDRILIKILKILVFSVAGFKLGFDLFGEIGGIIGIMVAGASVIWLESKN